jgi:hypothetical protein
MACQTRAPYWSVDSTVYHICGNCTTGDNIQPDKRKSGNPGKRTLCDRCKKIRAGKLTR